MLLQAEILVENIHSLFMFSNTETHIFAFSVKCIYCIISAFINYVSFSQLRLYKNPI
jgi:hypothetical protein